MCDGGKKGGGKQSWDVMQQGPYGPVKGDAGFATGFAKGHESGFGSGKEAGYAMGKEAGFDQGVEKGVEKGINIGKGKAAAHAAAQAVEVQDNRKECPLCKKWFASVENHIRDKINCRIRVEEIAQNDPVLYAECQRLIAEAVQWEAQRPA